MKATLGLEYIGFKFKKQPWVAQIIGKDWQFGFRRNFLRGNIDYSQASGTGKRGVYLWFILEDGMVYEVEHHVSWKNQRRYFCTVKEGQVIEISKAEVDAICEAQGLNTTRDFEPSTDDSEEESFDLIPVQTDGIFLELDQEAPLTINIPATIPPFELEEA